MLIKFLNVFVYLVCDKPVSYRKSVIFGFTEPRKNMDIVMTFRSCLLVKMI